MIGKFFKRSASATVAASDDARDLLAAARAERARRRHARMGGAPSAESRAADAVREAPHSAARAALPVAALAQRPTAPPQAPAERTGLPQRISRDLARLDDLLAANPRDLVSEIDPAVLGYFSAQYAREARLLPFRFDEGALWVATARPITRQLEQQTRWVIGLSGGSVDLRFARADAALLDRAIDVHYPEQRATSLAVASITQLATMFGAAAPDALAQNTLGNGLNQNTRGLVEHVLCLAVERRATDILIDAWETELLIRFKIDGACETALSGLPSHAGPQVISVIKQMARLKIFETEAQQSGGYEATVVYGDRPRRVEFRVEVTPTLYGESCSIRLHDAASRVLMLDALGTDHRTIGELRRFVCTRRGMLVLSGPTESGKTTTLYSILGEIDLSRENIVAIEDPVEIRLRGVRPIQVNEQKGVTFASSLRSVLRQNPDRILVGEVRDRETADLAVFAALTGHQVLTTAHADDAPRTVVRLVKEGIEPHNLASILDLVIAQRLVGRVCTVCAEPVVYDESVLRAAQFLPCDFDSIAARRGRGCKLCRWSGIDGRRALHETLRVTDEIRETIEAGAPSMERDLRRLGIASGMRPLRRVGLDLVKEGIVSLEQVLLMTPPLPDAYAGGEL